MHYVCPACGGVAQEPGVCKTDGCDNHGQPLQECNCDDGQHEEVMSQVQK